jgi:hypothetical protein
MVHLIEDKTVAKIGHPIVVVGQIWATRPLRPHTTHSMYGPPRPGAMKGGDPRILRFAQDDGRTRNGKSNSLACGPDA